MSCNRTIVRRKAVLCLSSFLRKSPDMAVEIRSLVRHSFADNDPGVVWAAVEVYLQLATVCSCSLVACNVFIYYYIFLSKCLKKIHINSSVF